MMERKERSVTYLKRHHFKKIRLPEICRKASREKIQKEKRRLREWKMVQAYQGKRLGRDSKIPRIQKKKMFLGESRKGRVGR